MLLKDASHQEPKQSFTYYCQTVALKGGDHLKMLPHPFWSNCIRDLTRVFIPNGGLVWEIPLFYMEIGWLVKYYNLTRSMGLVYFPIIYHKNQPNVGKYTSPIIYRSHLAW